MHITTKETLHAFPIRHHGPGSAFALLEALNVLRPDIILVEGPTDATPQLHWLSHAEMEPPVGLLSYRPDQPARSTIAPFAVFSPEYNAIRYGHDQGIPVRFFDLPYSHMLAIEISVAPPPSAPFETLAKATQVPSYERWWNLFVEQRQETADLFPSLRTLMSEMRRDLPEPDFTDEKHGESHLLAERREAQMRQEIRRAQREGFSRIALVIGGWHAPALTEAMIEEKTAVDAEILENLTHVPVEHAWIPWTYSRLSTSRGYGAGVRSPGWYHHLWRMKHEEADAATVAIGWLKKVADLLRGERLETSPAHLIETVRLAEALAAMRGLPFPGLPELNDAVQTVMCGGHAEPLQLIGRKLIIGERMGDVPPDSPQTPLQQDVRQRQKAVGLRPFPEKSTLTLDLRKENDKARSLLLHRLRLIDVPWGNVRRTAGFQQGTFGETWTLQWQPEYVIRLVTASMWGNSLSEAVLARVRELTDAATSVKQLTELLDKLIVADLPEAVGDLLTKISQQAAVTSDVVHLLQAIPPLARVMRYGDVRQTDKAMLAEVVQSLLTRVCVGLPSTCVSVDDEAARELFGGITAVHPTVPLLNEADLAALWTETLVGLANGRLVHGLLSGLACRLLFKGRHFDRDETMRQMSRALSVRGSAQSSVELLLRVAGWLEGFLHGSELLLLHDKPLWALLNEWVLSLPNEDFVAVVPLLRRTFAPFSESAKEQLGRRAHGHGMAGVRRETAVSTGSGQAVLDDRVGDAMLPYIATILGLEFEE